MFTPFANRRVQTDLLYPVQYGALLCFWYQLLFSVGQVDLLLKPRYDVLINSVN